MLQDDINFDDEKTNDTSVYLETMKNTLENNI